MITVVMHGIAGHAAAVVWVVLFFGMPVVAYFGGRAIGRDDGYWKAERDAQDAQQEGRQWP